jgi:hypothetical protein
MADLTGEQQGDRVVRLKLRQKRRKARFGHIGGRLELPGGGLLLWSGYGDMTAHRVRMLQRVQDEDGRPLERPMAFR